MLCSLCFKHKSNSIQLSCNHNVCLSCIPKRSPQQTFFRYQCETCLAFHDIDLAQKTPIGKNYFKELSRVSSQKSQQFSESQCIFCWTCYQAITLNQYIKGRHRDHSVQTFEQAIPSIKNLLIVQLEKSSNLKGYLNQNKEILENNCLKKSYEGLLDRINQFFHKQIQIIESKRQKMIGQIENQYTNCLKQVEKQVDVLTPYIEDIECLEAKISYFITDQIPITQINPISEVLSKVEDYVSHFKGRKFAVPDLPQFIAKSSVKESIQNGCSLLINKPNVQKNKFQEVSIRRLNLKEQFYSTDNTRLTKEQMATRSRINTNQQNDLNVNRKVRLVQKIKGKMKYTSSLCSTSFS